MRGAILILAALVQAHGPSHSVQTHRPARHAAPARARAPAEKSTAAAVPVFRIDGLIATAEGGRLSIQARGAVMGGGWKQAALRPAKGSAPPDPHVLVLDFVAVPPDPTEAVIPGLLPVSAAISVKTRKGLVSVRVVSGSNEITTQILKSGR
jgi:hypothetical protein